MRIPSLVTVVMLVCIGSAKAAAAPDSIDGAATNYVLPGCRTYALMAPSGGRYSSGTALRIGLCYGYLQAIADLAANIVCFPPDATIHQAAAVVVRYLDNRPERWNERFDALALEALRSEWPCKPGR